MAIITIGLNPAIDRILECVDFHVGGHQQAREVARLASGKAANVSRALAHLGVGSVATGFVGRDEGSFFREQLGAKLGEGKVLCHFVEVAGKTRENVTILDPKRKVETHVRDMGFAVTTDEISRLEQQLRRDLKAQDIALCSGSFCQGLPEHYLSSLIDLCADLGVQVGLDTKCILMLQSAPKHKVWIMKPNLEELRELLGKEVPNAASAIREAGMPLLEYTEQLLVSRGRNGAVLLTRGHGCFSARSLMHRDALRTVGCGDHLLAGYVAERAVGGDVERSLRRGMALATARALSPRLDGIDLEVYAQAAAGVEIEKI